MDDPNLLPGGIVMWHLWLEGRWAAPWLALPTRHSASRSARMRWTVACGSSRMSASSVESMNGVLLRESSSCQFEMAMCRAELRAADFCQSQLRQYGLGQRSY